MEKVESTIGYGILHFIATLVLGFLCLAAASSGLSDSYQGNSGGDGVLVALVCVFQAPVALAQWLAIQFSADGKTGLEMKTLFLVAIPSSLAYGYLISSLVRRLKSTK